MSWVAAPLNSAAPAIASDKKFEADADVWLLSLDQIESGTGEVLAKQRVPASKAGTSTFVFDEGNVLYSKLRPYLNKVVVPDERGIATTELVPLRPNPKILDRCYLAYYLRAPEFVSEASQRVAGAKMPRVSMDWLRAHEVPLPPPSEQRRIIEILDQADALRKQRRDADAKAARIVPALFLKTFGDPATNPMGWPKMQLGDLLKDAEVFTDGDWVESKDQDPNGEVRLIQLADVGEGLYLNKSSRFLTKAAAIRLKCTFLKPGDVLVARMPDPLGRACIFPGDSKEAVTVVDVCVVRPAASGPDPVWLTSCINTAGFRALIEQQRTGTTRDRISRGNLSRIPIIQPPAPLQIDFARLAQEAQNIVDVAHLNECVDGMFSLILQCAFSGQLTAKWRHAHMQELLAEMREQARLLDLPMPDAKEFTV